MRKDKDFIALYLYIYIHIYTYKVYVYIQILELESEFNGNQWHLSYCMISVMKLRILRDFRGIRHIKLIEIKIGTYLPQTL